MQVVKLVLIIGLSFPQAARQSHPDSSKVSPRDTTSQLRGGGGAAGRTRGTAGAPGASAAMEALRSSGLVQAVRAVNPLYTTASLHVNSQFVTLAQAAIIINTMNAGTGFGSGARPLIIRISREAVADTVFTIPGGVLPPAGGAFGGGGRGGRRRR